MKLSVEPKPVLAICPNPAWQKTLFFSCMNKGEVNRASGLKECGGGKTVNVARVFRLLGMSVTLASFVGGENGKKLSDELEKSGIGRMLVGTASGTRLCTTLISNEDHTATELIEPSGSITDDEKTCLLAMIKENLSSFGAVVLSGSMPPGVDGTFTAEVAAAALDARVPFVLDSFKGIVPALQTGLTLLKINAEELRALSGKSDLHEAGKSLLYDYPALKCLAVTDGAAPAWLFLGGRVWNISVPRLENIVTVIGCGDCATAIMARRIAEGLNDEDYPKAFAEALSCASASCLIDTPSVFEAATAEKLFLQTIIREC